MIKRITVEIVGVGYIFFYVENTREPSEKTIRTDKSVQKGCWI